MTLRPEWIIELPVFLQLADSLRQEIEVAASSVRTQASTAINQNLVQAQRHLLAIFKHLNNAFSAPLGERPQGDKERLLILVSFVQGAGYVEELIAEGQYIKSCSALRQDYEFITRIRELRKGVAQTGARPNMPNIRNAPEGSQRFYGQLSKIVHPVQPALLLNFLQSWDGPAKELVVSHLPHLVPQLASHLYLIHVWLTFEFAREALFLFSDMYGKDTDALERATFELNRAIWSLEAAGLTFTREVEDNSDGATA